MRSLASIVTVHGLVLAVNTFVFLPGVLAVELADEAMPLAGQSQSANAILPWLALALSLAAGAVLGAALAWAMLRRPCQNVDAPQAVVAAENASPGLNAANCLTAGCIHEFNNILCSVQGFTDLALLRSSATGPERAGLEQIRIGTERATRLLGQLERFNMEAASLQPVPLGLLLKGYGKFLQVEQEREQSERPQSWTELSIQVRDTTNVVQAEPLQMQRLLSLLHRAAVAVPAKNNPENGDKNRGTLTLRQQEGTQQDAGAAEVQPPRLELLVEAVAEPPEADVQALRQIVSELGGHLRIDQHRNPQHAGSSAYRLTFPAYAQVSPRH